MAYEVVARRWRPLTFASVVGQRHVTQTLTNAIERGRVAHAFLFTGIRGVGKTTVARLLARALNCENRSAAEPCNECRSCREILAGASVDVIEIDGASNRGIDEVRSLIETAQYRPAGGRYRVYIIDEVHQLTGAAFNALLKILEEPPEHVKFVLATTEAHKVPTTVLSRCQRYDFRRIRADEIRRQLEQVVERDELDVASDALALIAREADGSMRDAQSLLEQVVAAVGEGASADSVAEILGIAREELVARCVEAILDSNPADVVAAVDEVRRNGYDAERFLANVLDLVRHVTVATAAGAHALGGTVSEETERTIERLKNKRSTLDLQRVFEALLTTAEAMRRGSLPDLVLEMGLLKTASFDGVLSASEILARLEATEGSSPQSGGSPHTSAKRVPRQTAPADNPKTIPNEVSGETKSVSAREWEGFLKLVSERGEFDLYVTLANCEVSTVEPDRWVLKPMIASFRGKLEQPSTMKQVAALVADCVGRPVAIEIDPGNGSVEASAGVSAHAIERGHKDRVEEAALSDPVVQAALRVLGGKVDKIARLDD